MGLLVFFFFSPQEVHDSPRSAHSPIRTFSYIKIVEFDGFSRQRRKSLGSLTERYALG